MYFHKLLVLLQRALMELQDRADAHLRVILFRNRSKPVLVSAQPRVLQYPEIMSMANFCLSARNLVYCAQSAVQLSALSSSGGFVIFVGAKILNS